MKTVDEWMEEVHESMYASVVPAQSIVQDTGKDGVLASGEIRVGPRPGQADKGIVYRVSLKMAYEKLVVELETTAMIYISNCNGYSIRYLAKEGWKMWDDAPRTDWGVRQAIETGRSNWAASLKDLGITADYR